MIGGGRKGWGGNEWQWCYFVCSRAGGTRLRVPGLEDNWLHCKDIPIEVDGEGILADFMSYKYGATSRAR